MTNADRIRQMTDDELTKLLVWGHMDMEEHLPSCEIGCKHYRAGCAMGCPPQRRENAMREWLNTDENPEDYPAEKKGRIVLPFVHNGHVLHLVAEDIDQPEFGPEIAVGISDPNDNWLQDLAIVRMRGKDGEDESGEKHAELLIYGDEYDEDYTRKDKISLYPQECEEYQLPDLK